MDTSNWISLGILLVTAVVGFLSWLAAFKAAREAREDQKEANAAARRSADAAESATDIQSQMLEIEEQRHMEAGLTARRAILTASIVREQTPHSSGRISTEHYLVVQNTGSGQARNLKINVEGQSIDQHQSVNTPQPVSKMSIGPGGTLKFLLSLTRGLQPPFDCELLWEDDSGVSGEWKGSLT